MHQLLTVFLLRGPYLEPSINVRSEAPTVREWYRTWWCVFLVRFSRVFNATHPNQLCTEPTRARRISHVRRPAPTGRRGKRQKSIVHARTTLQRTSHQRISVQSYGISGRLAPAGRCAAQYAISDSLRKCLDESYSVPPHKSFQAGRHVATRPKATTTKTVHTPIFQAQTNMLPTKVLPIMAQKRVRCCSRSGKCHWTH